MRVLVCGCGSIGKKHLATIGRSFAHELYVYDPDPSALHDLPADVDVICCSSQEQAYAARPDVVIISGPTSSHIPDARRAIEAGAHVFIEKPISHRWEDVEQFLGEAEAKNLMVCVGSNMRFHTGPKLLRQHLSELGRVYFSRADVGFYLPYMRPGVDYRELYAARKALGGGVILDDIHEIDYHIWLFGDVAEIFCSAIKLSDMEMDAEDCADLFMRFSSSVSATIHFDYLNKCRTRRCEIVGENGTLLWEERGKPPHCTVKLYDDRSRKWRILRNGPVLDLESCFVEQFRDFFKKIDGGDDCVIADGRQGLYALKIALEAKASAATKRSTRI